MHIALPAFTLGLSAAAILTRQLRGAMIDVMQQDYVRSARAKGLPYRKVVAKHALKNAASGTSSTAASRCEHETIVD